MSGLTLRLNNFQGKSSSLLLVKKRLKQINLLGNFNHTVPLLMPLEVKMFSISSNRPVAMLSQNNSTKRQWTINPMPAAILEVDIWGNWCQVFLLVSIPLSLFWPLKTLILRKGLQGKPNDQKHLWPSYFLLLSLTSLEMISRKQSVKKFWGWAQIGPLHPKNNSVVDPPFKD